MQAFGMILSEADWLSRTGGIAVTEMKEQLWRLLREHRKPPAPAQPSRAEHSSNVLAYMISSFEN
jgi:hypothetical protein